MTGCRYILCVKKIKKNEIILSVKENTEIITQTPLISLFQALPKGKIMDRIIRQATETGISRIIPVITRYTIATSHSGKSINNKMQRWRRIIKEAIQQSEGMVLPCVFEPVNISDALKLCRGIKLFFHQEKKGNKALHECLSYDIDEISIFIGPEGGFSNFEYRLLKDNGFIPINLGKNILRVDTASLFAIAAVKIIVLEKEKWRRM